MSAEFASTGTDHESSASASDTARDDTPRPKYTSASGAPERSRVTMSSRFSVSGEIVAEPVTSSPRRLRAASNASA